MNCPDIVNSTLYGVTQQAIIDSCVLTPFHKLLPGRYSIPHELDRIRAYIFLQIGSL
jgi:hypothetical protein